MSIITRAGWQHHSEHKGVAIYRDATRGKWAAFDARSNGFHGVRDSLRAVREYIDQTTTESEVIPTMHI